MSAPRAMLVQKAVLSCSEFEDLTLSDRRGETLVAHQHLQQHDEHPRHRDKPKVGWSQQPSQDDEHGK